MTATIKQVISMALILSMITFASCPHAYSDEPLNLVKNPSFEDIGTWKTSTADANDVADPRNSSRAHSGEYSAYTKATTIGGDGYAFVYQDLSIPISSNLELSFWLYVKRHELPFYGYIKCFVASSGGRYFDVGIWSEDSPRAKANEYRVQTRVEKYDAWFKVRADLGRLWISEAKYPTNDVITSISLGIYNGLVYALPKNLIQLEAFFDDVFLGPKSVEEEPNGRLWLIYLAAAAVVSAATLFVVARKKMWLKSHPRNSMRLADSNWRLSLLIITTG